MATKKQTADSVVMLAHKYASKSLHAARKYALALIQYSETASRADVAAVRKRIVDADVGITENRIDRDVALARIPLELFERAVVTEAGGKGRIGYTVAERLMQCRHLDTAQAVACLDSLCTGVEAGKKWNVANALQALQVACAGLVSGDVLDGAALAKAMLSQRRKPALHVTPPDSEPKGKGKGKPNDKGKPNSDGDGDGDDSITASLLDVTAALDKAIAHMVAAGLLVKGTNTAAWISCCRDGKESTLLQQK